MSYKYEYEKYKTDIKNLKVTLETYGVAIIPNVLNKKECTVMFSEMLNYFEHTTSE